MNEKIKGLIAAPFTPMKANGSINPMMIKKYASHLKSKGVSGAFACGTTGEGMLLTLQERKMIAEYWINEQSDDFKVIVHVGATSPRDSSDLARHASDAEAYAVACMGPMFLRPSTVDDLVTFCVEVADGSPDLPFYYYHIPIISGVALSMPEFLQKAQTRISNLAGIKFTHKNVMELAQCLFADESRWDILQGLDEELLAGLSLGIKGAVGSTYNYLAPLYVKLIDAFNKGDIALARHYQSLSIRFVEILNQYGGGVAGGKPVMKFKGFDFGPLRAPAHNLSDEDATRYRNELQRIGFFDWCDG